MSELRPRRSRVAVLFAALAVFAALSTPWTAVTASSQTPANAIAFERSNAEADFPAGIRFSLTAAAPEAPERVELLYHVAGDTTLHLALPEANFSNERVIVEDSIDLQADYLPAGVELRYFWRIIAADGGWTDSPEHSVLWHDTRFTWRSVSSEQVTVHSHDLSESFGREILVSAQQTVDELEAAYGLTMSAPLAIWVYSNTEALSGAQRPNSREAIAGVAYPKYGVINAAVPEADSTELGRVIPHEVSHLVLHQATANPFAPLPLWLDEGLAVHYQDGGKEHYPRVVSRALAENRLFSLQALGASFPFNPEGTSLAYAQSLSAVTYILDRYGEQGMTDLLGAIGEGVSLDEALRMAFGVDLATFDLEWRAWLSANAERADVMIDPMARRGTREAA